MSSGYYNALTRDVSVPWESEVLWRHSDTQGLYQDGHPPLPTSSKSDKPLQGMAPTPLPQNEVLTCMPACVLPCIFACFNACLLIEPLLACMLAQNSCWSQQLV